MISKSMIYFVSIFFFYRFSLKSTLIRYKVILESSLRLEKNERIEEIKTFVDYIIHENVGLVTSRQLFSDLCAALAKLSVDDAKFIATYALDKIQPRAISFEDQVKFILTLFYF